MITLFTGGKWIFVTKFYVTYLPPFSHRNAVTKYFVTELRQYKNLSLFCQRKFGNKGININFCSKKVILLKFCHWNIIVYFKKICYRMFRWQTNYHQIFVLKITNIKILPLTCWCSLFFSNLSNQFNSNLTPFFWCQNSNFVKKLCH